MKLSPDLTCDASDVQKVEWEKDNTLCLNSCTQPRKRTFLFLVLSRSLVRPPRTTLKLHVIQGGCADSRQCIDESKSIVGKKYPFCKTVFSAVLIFMMANTLFWRSLGQPHFWGSHLGQPCIVAAANHAVVWDSCAILPSSRPC